MSVIKSLKDENEFLRSEVDHLRSDLIKERKWKDMMIIFFRGRREILGLASQNEDELPSYAELVRMYKWLQRQLDRNFPDFTKRKW